LSVSPSADHPITYRPYGATPTTNTTMTTTTKHIFLSFRLLLTPHWLTFTLNSLRLHVLRQIGHGNESTAASLSSL
jgi:hypothetical protein